MQVELRKSEKSDVYWGTVVPWELDTIIKPGDKFRLEKVKKEDGSTVLRLSISKPWSKSNSKSEDNGL